MKQVYHSYLFWEDFKNGMWRKETKEYEDRELPNVVLFTADTLAYGTAMIRVIKEWKIACEHNLTNRAINRRAWIGHAACCLERGYPEYMVRMAWMQITEQQRIEANLMADSAIQKWTDQYNSKLYNTQQLTLWSNE